MRDRKSLSLVRQALLLGGFTIKLERKHFNFPSNSYTTGVLKSCKIKKPVFYQRQALLSAIQRKLGESVPVSSNFKRVRLVMQSYKRRIFLNKYRIYLNRKAVYIKTCCLFLFFQS